MAQNYFIGQRISYDGSPCSVRYIGEVAGANGSWLGVEWDDPTRGKHDGSHKGVRYFTCLSKTSTAASFVRPTRPADAPQSFISALKGKYIEQDNEQDKKVQIVISGKVAEEMGFDKIRRQIAQLEELKIIILDGVRIASAVEAGDDSISKTCPKVVQLDISRNLLHDLEPVVAICKELPLLQKLALNGNRFQQVLSDSSSLNNPQVSDLGLGGTLLSWQEICHISNKFPSLTTLAAGTNQLSSLPKVDFLGLSTTLTTLNLEFNEFCAISDVRYLTDLQALRNLHLKGNNISAISSSSESTALAFSSSLKYLDLSYNNIEDWTFVDNLITIFPGLSGLRISHNPIYSSHGSDDRGTTSEESYMFTVARIAQLKSLNFSNITVTDRSNAEIFYLSRIAKQITNVPEGSEKTVTDLHPRYDALCQIYGDPDIVRREEINSAFLEARLINVAFSYEGSLDKTARIPKSFDIYAVKGIASKLFDKSPLQLKLVWETDDWDPVAGFDDDDGDSSDDDDGVNNTTPNAERRVVETELPVSGEEAEADGAGRWVKREIELSDAPRQLGYCVEGTDVRIRVEAI